MLTISSTSAQDHANQIFADCRDSARVRTVYRVARVKARGDEGLARVRNISDGGMMLSLGIPVLIGDRVRVSLSDNLVIDGRVVWTNGDECGVKFDQDLDSIAALRQTADEIRTGATRPPRLSLGVPAVVSSEHGLKPTRVSDISQRGMKISHDGSFKPGLSVKVMLQSGIERRGFVRWVSEDLAGLIINDPFTVEDLGSVSCL